MATATPPVQPPGRHGPGAGGTRQGDPGRGREPAHDGQAPRARSAWSPPRTPGGPTASCCSPRRGSPTRSAASSSSTRRCGSASSTGALPARDPGRGRASCPASRSTGARSPLAGAPGELVTQGLDGLRERFAEYAALGARFAKWRAVLRIGPGLPSRACVEANAHALARYAALAQEAGLVPVVEPEVLMDGSHGLERCAEVTAQVLREVYAELAGSAWSWTATLLKPSMVLPGTTSPEAEQVGDDEVAARTIAVLRDTVPASVPGIVFLSGGQSPQQATARLDALNRLGVHQPWQLSFSFGRALQAPVLDAWRGEPDNVGAGPGRARRARPAHQHGAARALRARAGARCARRRPARGRRLSPTRARHVGDPRTSVLPAETNGPARLGPGAPPLSDGDAPALDHPGPAPRLGPRPRPRGRRRLGPGLRGPLGGPRGALAAAPPCACCTSHPTTWPWSRGGWPCAPRRTSAGTSPVTGWPWRRNRWWATRYRSCWTPPATPAWW